MQRIHPEPPPRGALMPEPRFPRPRIGPGPSTGASMQAVRAAMKARHRRLEATARSVPR